jgi:CSLREA domain-containing protein
LYPRGLFRFLIGNALLFVALTLSLAGPAHAATITVNSVADAGGTCPGGNCTLRQAIATAGSGDTINFSLPANSTITLTSGELLIDKNLTINGPGPNLLTVQRSSAAPFRIFNIASGSISGLEIAGGKAEIGAGANSVGGTIRNCLITNNQATGDWPRGGGVYCDGGTVSHCVISGNSVTSTNTDPYSAFAEGGGIYAIDESQIDHSTVTNNTITGYYANGAGINANNGTVQDCTVSGNTAYGNWYANGGGVYMTANVDGLVRNCLITGNNAHTDRGAFSANWAAGGGVYFNGGGTLESSTVYGNSLDGDTSTGGGLAYGGQIRNTIIYGNTATARMTVTGPNYYLNPSGPATFDHCCSTPLPSGAGNIASDPGFASGGYHLDTGSPCIDTGTNQAWMTAATDLDANPRIANATVDIGAFEFPIPHTLGNISTRSFVQTGNNVLIGGLIISGSGAKQVILRALGPTLGQPPFNIPNALANPTLELRNGSGALITSNDNWEDAANQQAVSDSGYAPPNNLESAILTSLVPGSYTAIVRGVNNTTGVAIVEGYDLDLSTEIKFGNISTRGFVGTGNSVMIAGVIVKGMESENVIIRGLGPTLTQFGVPNVLADPVLDLRDGNGNPVASNDNWKDTQEAQIQASGKAPPNDKESAIAATLPAGNYTAILSGKSNSTGNALVEVYGLN